MNKKQFGVWAENLASQYLVKWGYQIIERNWRCRFGELDIVAIKGKIIHFVEVKARRSRRFGTGAEALTFTKINRLQAAIVGYLGGQTSQLWQLDLVVVEGRGQFYKIDYYPAIG